MQVSSALRLTALAAALILGGYAQARSVSLTDGRTIVDPVVLSQRPDGLEVGHKDGVAFIKFAVMPPEIQKKFNYDSAKAAAYEQQRQQAKSQALVVKERRAAAAAVQRAKFNEQMKTRRAEQLAEELEMAKIRIEFLKGEIPKLEQSYQQNLDKSAELAGKDVSKPRAIGGTDTYGDGYSVIMGNTGSRAESSKRRTLKLMSDELAETKKTLEAYKLELEDKQFQIIEMQKQLDAMGKK